MGLRVYRGAATPDARPVAENQQGVTTGVETRGRPKILPSQKGKPRRNGIQRTRLTPEDKKAIIEVYLGTGGKRDITALKFQISERTVQRVVDEAKANSLIGEPEVAPNVAADLKQAMTSKARMILDTITADVVNGASLSQRAIAAGIFTDKAIALRTSEREEQQAHEFGLPSAADVQQLQQMVAQRLAAMPWLQVNVYGKQLLERAQDALRDAIPADAVPVEAHVVDLDGNDGRLTALPEPRAILSQEEAEDAQAAHPPGPHPGSGAVPH